MSDPALSEQGKLRPYWLADLDQTATTRLFSALFSGPHHTCNPGVILAQFLPPPQLQFTHQQRINEAFPPNSPKEPRAQLVVAQGLS